MSGTEQALDSAIKLIPVVVSVYAALAGVWRFVKLNRRSFSASAAALLISLAPIAATATLAVLESKLSLAMLLVSIWTLFLVLLVYVVYIFVTWPVQHEPPDSRDGHDGTQEGGDTES